MTTSTPPQPYTADRLKNSTTSVDVNFSGGFERGRRRRLAGNRQRPIPRATDPGSARRLPTGGGGRGIIADRVCRGARGHGASLVFDRWRTIAGLGWDRGPNR